MTAYDQPVLDHAVVATLRSSIGDDDAFMAELVETYVAEGEASLGDLLAAAATGDCAAIVRPAHTLKSTSASLGAMRLAAICRSLEEAGREVEPDRLVQEAELARLAWEATLAAFGDAGLRG